MHPPEAFWSFGSASLRMPLGASTSIAGWSRPSQDLGAPEAADPAAPHGVFDDYPGKIGGQVRLAVSSVPSVSTVNPRFYKMRADD